MAKVTIKLHVKLAMELAQVTRPGLAMRRRLFDQATERQRQRELENSFPKEKGSRDWTRGDLYDGRGSSR